MKPQPQASTWPGLVLRFRALKRNSTASTYRVCEYRDDLMRRDLFDFLVLSREWMGMEEWDDYY
jgi:hypothetical protein